jgi:hypothetical protein
MGSVMYQDSRQILVVIGYIARERPGGDREAFSGTSELSSSM